MNTLQIGEPLQHWLESLPHTVPLHAVSISSGSPINEGKGMEQLITDSRLPADSLITAMLWMRIGVIDIPHKIVQNGTTPLSSYLHGVVHRLEADYWNSKYWFRQVRDIRLLQSLSNSVERKLKEESLLSMASSLHIMQGNVFFPGEFVSASEMHCQQSLPDSECVAALEHIGWVEWDCLWEMIYTSTAVA